MAFYAAVFSKRCTLRKTSQFTLACSLATGLSMLERTVRTIFERHIHFAAQIACSFEQCQNKFVAISENSAHIPLI